VLFSAGDQFPVIPFSDVVGNAVNVPPEQIGATALNVGIELLLTLSLMMPLLHIAPLLA
jgi:hypothetical protein